jgi:hypothetical protein
VSKVIAVDAEALRTVLNALVNAPHMIRELQATREPVALFKDNPINILIDQFDAQVTQGVPDDQVHTLSRAADMLSHPTVYGPDAVKRTVAELHAMLAAAPAESKGNPVRLRFEEGRKAALDGLGISDNPYVPGYSKPFTEAHDWQRGYDSVNGFE